MAIRTQTQYWSSAKCSFLAASKRRQRNWHAAASRAARRSSRAAQKPPRAALRRRARPPRSRVLRAARRRGTLPGARGRLGRRAVAETCMLMQRKRPKDGLSPTQAPRHLGGERPAVRDGGGPGAGGARGRAPGALSGHRAGHGVPRRPRREGHRGPRPLGRLDGRQGAG